MRFGGVSNNYGVAGFQGLIQISGGVSGIGFGAAITGLEFWGHIKRGSATSINNAFLLLDDICLYMARWKTLPSAVRHFCAS